MAEKKKPNPIGRPRGQGPGKRNPVPEHIAADVGDLQFPRQVKALLQRLANHTIRGEITTTQCSALNGLLMTWCKLYEMDDVLQRMIRIEEKLDKSIKGMKTRGRR